MDEVTDGDIAEAMKLGGYHDWNDAENIPYVRKRGMAGAAPQKTVLEFAHTLAKLRIAREALYQAHETMFKTTAVLTTTDCADVAKAMSAIRDALSQIKGE